MTQLDRSVAPAIRQLEHFSILQPELHRMKNGMPLYVLSAGNEDVIRFGISFAQKRSLERLTYQLLISSTKSSNALAASGIL